VEFRIEHDFVTCLNDNVLEHRFILLF
jgi:hypothetical protein